MHVFSSNKRIIKLHERSLHSNWQWGVQLYRTTVPKNEIQTQRANQKTFLFKFWLNLNQLLTCIKVLCYSNDYVYSMIHSFACVPCMQVAMNLLLDNLVFLLMYIIIISNSMAWGRFRPFAVTSKSA
jgi:hypothetical protein